MVPEVHPKLTVTECTSNACIDKEMGITIDANWRWYHNKEGYDNCFDSNGWSSAYCPDAATCNQNCVVEGNTVQNYANTYGVVTSDRELSLAYVTNKNVGSRNYLMDDDDNYKVFKLKNREFTFDVDESSLGCGINGAVYFVSMDGDGGTARFSGNTAGAKYGTGYCDAQSPRDVKFIGGLPNLKNWTGGKGSMGSSCVEMDLWEANTFGHAITPHSCGDIVEQTSCKSDGCEGVCDTSGCDFNPYRFGNRTFYGPTSDHHLNSKKPITVVTQFITDDGTDTGRLTEIRRLYRQGGKVIQQPTVTIDGVGNFDSISESYCRAEGAYFNQRSFELKGGLASMDAALDKGMLLVLSIWDDGRTYMKWLDSTFGSGFGAQRGPCPIDAGNPETIRTSQASAVVKYSNIKFGAIGST